MPRDWIPATGKATEVERKRAERAREFYRGHGSPDYIPAKGHVRREASGRQGQAKEALERALARQATQAREDFANAVERMRTLTVQQAIDLIIKAPAAVSEMLIVAEMETGQRSSILKRFAPVDPATVEKWRSISKTGVSETPTARSTSTEKNDGEEKA